MRLKKLQKINLLLTAVFILLTACANNTLVPVERNGVTTEDGYAVLRTDSLFIAVRPQIWYAPQSNIRPNYFSLSIQIKNTSNRKIDLHAKSIKVISEGIQFDVVPLQYVLQGIRNDLMASQYNDIFSEESATDIKLKQQQGVSELINAYFVFGDILPGTTKKGYLFFDPQLLKSDRIQIDAFDSMMYFTKPQSNK